MDAGLVKKIGGQRSESGSKVRVKAAEPDGAGPGLNGSDSSDVQLVEVS